MIQGLVIASETAEIKLLQAKAQNDQQIAENGSNDIFYAIISDIRLKWENEKMNCDDLGLIQDALSVLLIAQN